MLWEHKGNEDTNKYADTIRTNTSGGLHFICYKLK
jgi:hypothetical protein